MRSKFTSLAAIDSDREAYEPKFKNEVCMSLNLNKSKSSFAPASHYKKIEEFVSPSRGTIIEVLVCWNERLLNSYHFSKPGNFTYGSHPDADIHIPLAFAKQKKSTLFRIDSKLMVTLAPDMKGVLMSEKGNTSFEDLLFQKSLSQNKNLYRIDVEQNEMLKIDLGEIQILFRYVSKTPMALSSLFLDLTAAEGRV